MSANSSLFKPGVSGKGLGSKQMNDGQFANPPAYPDVSGITGPSKITDDDKSVMPLQKTPSAKTGRV